MILEHGVLHTGIYTYRIDQCVSTHYNCVAYYHGMCRQKNCLSIFYVFKPQCIKYIYNMLSYGRDGSNS